MVSRSKFIHSRLASLVAAIFLTLTLAGWALDPVAVAPAATTAATPEAVPATTPPSISAPSPSPVPPATGGDAAPAVKPADKTPAASDAKVEDAPVQLPVVQPIVIHADRDAEIGRVVGVLLEQNHYLQKPI